MAGVKYYFCLADDRLHFQTFVPKTKFYTSNELTTVTEVWPLHTLLLVSTTRYNVLTSSVGNASNLMVGLLKNYYTFSLFLKTELNSLYFPVDLSVFSERTSVLQSIALHYSNYLSSSTTTLLSHVQDSEVYSLSNIYQGFTWVERETKEFDSITFVGLRDTRRLLTDYTFLTDDEEYRTLGYNLTTQEVYYG